MSVYRPMDANVHADVSMYFMSVGIVFYQMMEARMDVDFKL